MKIYIWSSSSVDLLRIFKFSLVIRATKGDFYSVNEVTFGLHLLMGRNGGGGARRTNPVWRTDICQRVEKLVVDDYQWSMREWSCPTNKLPKAKYKASKLLNIRR